MNFCVAFVETSYFKRNKNIQSLVNKQDHQKTSE